MKSTGLLIAFLVMALSLQACNFQLESAATPAATPTISSTFTATLIATRTPSSTPPADTAVPGTPMDTPLIPNTGGLAAPQVSVYVTTNCRSGPGTVYNLVGIFYSGQATPILGKYTPGNYWIINIPSGTCWLWGQYAVVTGDTSSLPEYPVPATPTPTFKPTQTFTATPTVTLTPTFTPTPTVTPAITFTPTPTVPLAPTVSLTPTFPLAPTVSPTPTVPLVSTNTLTPTDTLTLTVPNQPTHLMALWTCTSAARGTRFDWQQAITLTWQDAADNESGYRIFKNSSLLSDLAANSTRFQLTLTYPQGAAGPGTTFGVEAFNNAGASMLTSISVPHCQ